MPETAQQETVQLSGKKEYGAFLPPFVRFCTIGALNTVVDLGVFNALLFLSPTKSVVFLLGYSSLAYFLGSINSFGWNKWWTFRGGSGSIWGQPGRFVLVVAVGMGGNGAVLWLVCTLMGTLSTGSFLWLNVAKVIAIESTFLISYLGMHFVVFWHFSKQEPGIAANRPWVFPFPYSLSVVLPVYNEEAVIGTTITHVQRVLDSWGMNFEILVVNDGSLDQTESKVQPYILMDQRIKLFTHERNKGYGDALKTGFSHASKELTFFMDSDGQFDIRDLALFFPLIEEYGAVLGYRVKRQDGLGRKLNAWGWKMLVSSFFGIRVRDIDCAFKLFRTGFFRSVTLESGGAMINTEILYKLARAGYTCTEVGVVHLPRKAGRATGAKLSVILRALGQLFYFSEKWRKEQFEDEIQGLTVQSQFVK